MAQLTDVARNVDEQELNGDTVIDFDIAANSDYEIQCGVVVNDNDEVVEAAVRFGRVEEHPEIGVGHSIIYDAWINMVKDATAGLSYRDDSAVEADLSDFQHIVPHLKVGPREDIEEFGLDTLTLDELVTAVVKLSALVERVFRGDVRTIDREIDDWL